ncbi:MAG: GNAT family N-acetyltransferase [Dehalococcoidia bacterium]
MTHETIREATEADLPQIVALLAQLDPDDPGREDTTSPLPAAYQSALQRLTGAGHKLFVLDDGSRLLGTLALYVVPNISHNGSPFAVVENVVVDDQERSKSYGKLLMERAEETARALGCYKLTLTSNKRRAEAHRFYERLGFQRSSEGFRKNL